MLIWPLNVCWHSHTYCFICDCLCSAVPKLVSLSEISPMGKVLSPVFRFFCDYVLVIFHPPLFTSTNHLGDLHRIKCSKDLGTALWYGRHNCNCKIWSSKRVVILNLSISLTRYLNQVKRSVFRNVSATQLEVHLQCGKKNDLFLHALYPNYSISWGKKKKDYSAFGNVTHSLPIHMYLSSSLCNRHVLLNKFIWFSLMVFLMGQLDLFTEQLNYCLCTGCSQLSWLLLYKA